MAARFSADKDRLADHVDAAKGLTQGIDGEQKQNA